MYLYRQKNKEYFAKYDRRYYKKHKKKVHIRNKRRYKNNKKEASKKHKVYYRKNKLRIIKKERKWRKSNKRKVSIGLKKWCRKNKQRVSYYSKKRRGLKLRGGNLPLERIDKVYADSIKKYGKLTCYLCLKPIKKGQDCLEHKTPLSRGGTNKFRNLDIACKKCNGSKHDKTEKEYGKWLKEVE